MYTDGNVLLLMEIITTCCGLSIVLCCFHSGVQVGVQFQLEVLMVFAVQ